MGLDCETFLSAEGEQTASGDLDPDVAAPRAQRKRQLPSELSVRQLTQKPRPGQLGTRPQPSAEHETTKSSAGPKQATS
jgi:hypothetical protein